MSACQQQDMFGPPKTFVVHKQHVYADAKRVRIVEDTRVQVTIGGTDDRTVYAKELAELEALRPKTRGECHAARAKVWAKHEEPELRELAPCPFMSCKHHLWLDVEDDDNAARETIDAQLPAVEHSCALDVVDAFPDGLMDHQVGAILGLTDEMVRQVNERSLVQLRTKKTKTLEGYGIMTTQRVSQMERF